MMDKLTYRESGVDVVEADHLISRYASLAKKTNTDGVLGGIGGFAGFYSLPTGLDDPVLVACTDGVGTKLRLLIDGDQVRTAGKDAAAMCLNDLATCGARPLFMLDYLAVGKLEPNVATAVVAGFADYCRQANCALLGGETAEMPGFYPQGDFDVAGFAIGVVERKNIIDGRSCRAGDLVLGLASSGLHSNGFSLVRLLLDKGFISAGDDCGGTPLGQALLTPTRLYLPLAQELAALPGVKAMAHITGGALPGNIGRTVPDNLDVVVDLESWPRPPVYTNLTQGGVSPEELMKTFNMGIGFTVVVDRKIAETVQDLCQGAGIETWQIGKLEAGSGKVKFDGRL